MSREERRVSHWHRRLQYGVAEETIVHKTPYRSCAIYLARKHIPVSSAGIGRYFGGITCSAVTKTATGMKQKLEKHKVPNKEMNEIEARLSDVNG
jgi:hypothetical protein